MNILVSGCNGFIGKHLVKSLKNKGFYFEGLSSKKILVNYKIHKVDLRNFDMLKKIRSRKIFDAVIHLAGDTEEKDLLSMFRSNVLSTFNLLEFCRLKKIEKFIYISGHNVYSPSKNLPIKENFQKTPVTNYGFTKLISEKLVKFYNEKYKISSVVLRISYTYGKGQKKDRMLSQMILNYKNSKKIFLYKYTNGFQKMDLIHVSDVCTAIINSLRIKKKYSVYNISSGKPVNVRDILKILRKNIKSKSLVKVKNINKKINHFYYDISCAKNEINFSPNISLEKGIKELLIDST